MTVHMVFRANDPESLNDLLRRELVRDKEGVYHRPGGPLEEFLPVVKSDTECGIVELGSYVEYVNKSKAMFHEYMANVPDLNENKIRALKPARG